ncbi:hypothetical protein NHX12_017646 [Muraenolepis orangiensis]|uniref:Uncharacterized protein n=1 Tax=Muraenolepis orangiensis TaxID=630683 RepID=A0A9Q0EV97_9TELE|nr:hypothetical protein NHX12_017646 [Muraenolepis orangiensis]
MLRHCPIARFSSGARKKMSKEDAKKEKEKEKANLAESRALHLAEPEDVAEEHAYPQKVLKIFNINIIAQGLPFCRRRKGVAGTPLTVDEMYPCRSDLLGQPGKV